MDSVRTRLCELVTRFVWKVVGPFHVTLYYGASCLTLKIGLKWNESLHHVLGLLMMKSVGSWRRRRRL